MIFLLKKLLQNNKINKINPIIKDGKFINLEVIYKIGDNKYKITFRDSYLLLNSSLSKLSKAFNGINIKGIFPYDFVNENNLNYIGNVPDIKYFSNITEDQYKDLTSMTDNNWNLKNEAIKYCEIECISLFQVLETFGKLIFDLFQINITKISTLPSLVFKIFRVHFLSKSVKLPVLSGKIYDSISQAI